jgi:hypothetical protein
MVYSEALDFASSASNFLPPIQLQQQLLSEFLKFPKPLLKLNILLNNIQLIIKSQ